MKRDRKKEVSPSLPSKNQVKFNKHPSRHYAIKSGLIPEKSQTLVAWNPPNHNQSQGQIIDLSVIPPAATPSNEANPQRLLYLTYNTASGEYSYVYPNFQVPNSTTITETPAETPAVEVKEPEKEPDDQDQDSEKVSITELTPAPEAIYEPINSSLIRYHIAGGKGWQRIFGYGRSTDIQPIRIIKDARIYGLIFSSSGIGTITMGTIQIHKNMRLCKDPIESVISTINISDDIVKPSGFTIFPGETITIEDNIKINWDHDEHLVLNRNDYIGIFADNIVGTNIELLIEYCT